MRENIFLSLSFSLLFSLSFSFYFFLSFSLKLETILTRISAGLFDSNEKESGTRGEYFCSRTTRFADKVSSMIVSSTLKYQKFESGEKKV